MPKRGADSKSDYQKYKSYYIARETSAAGKAKRTERDQGRTAMIKSGALKGPHDPREVDHKKPLAKGGSGARSNLRVISQKANREKFDH